MLVLAWCVEPENISKPQRKSVPNRNMTKEQLYRFHLATIQ